jgi:hypothetical protein
MISSEQIAQTFNSNLFVTKLRLENISNEDSFFQPPYQGNCLNWILGHMIASRNSALKLLQAIPVFSEAEEALYQTGSEPLTGADQGIPFHELVTRLELSQARLDAALISISSDFMSDLATTSRGEKPIWQHVSGLAWHETYHAGQLEILQQIIIGTKANMGNS